MVKFRSRRRRKKSDDSERQKKYLVGIPNVTAIKEYFEEQQISFTKSQKSIADHIIQDPEVIQNQLLAKFSSSLRVGEASVMRFCKLLGFKGFSDFKKFFIEKFFIIPTEAENYKVYEIEYNGHLSTIDVLTKITNQLAKITQETKVALVRKHQILKEVAQRIANKKKVFIYGSPIHHGLIEEYAAKFFSVGIHVIYSSHVHDVVLKCPLVDRNEVALFISPSGYCREVNKVVIELIKRNIFIVGLTNDSRSELAINSDVVFDTFGKYDKDFHTLPDTVYARLSQMIVLDSILSLVIDLNIEMARELRIETVDTLERYLRSKEISLQSEEIGRAHV